MESQEAEKNQVVLRKLTAKDYEVIRDRGLDTDEQGKPRAKIGTMTKLYVCLGIKSADFFSTTYPEGDFRAEMILAQREEEYYKLPQTKIDELYRKIVEHNQIDTKSLDNLKKKQS